MTGASMPDFGGIGNFLGQIGGQYMANQANAQMSKDQMNFQRDMSNTAHRREVKDLRAAGLNPILSATGGQGATTPQGAQARIENVVGPAISSALELKKIIQQNKAVDSQVLLNQAQALGAKAGAMRDTTSAANTNLQNQLLSKTMGAKAAETNFRGKTADMITKGMEAIESGTAKTAGALGTASGSVKPTSPTYERKFLP